MNEEMMTLHPFAGRRQIADIVDVGDDIRAVVVRQFL